jgi:erythromycin esterase
MQLPQAAAAAVLTFLRAADPAAHQQADAALACLRPFETRSEINALYRGYPQQPPEQQSACRAGLQAIHDRIVELQGRATSAAAGMRALSGARTLVQFEQLLRHQSLRDRFMAENLTWLLEQRYPGSRAVVWSHNGHVVRQPGRLGGIVERHLGAEAVLHLGFTFYRGSFNAIEVKKDGTVGRLRTFQAKAPAADSWESLFHTAALPRGLIDLSSRASQAPAWVARPHPLRGVGALYGGDPQTSQVMADLRRELDFLIYLEQATPSELLSFDRSSFP